MGHDEQGAPRQGDQDVQGKQDVEGEQDVHKKRREDEETSTPPLDWRMLLEVLGAAAGITAFIGLVGGALLWLRFDELGLPADRGVALLPESMLVTVGAHQLFIPAAAGLVAVVALFAARPEYWSTFQRRLAAGLLAGVITAIVLALAGAHWIIVVSATAVIAGGVAGPIYAVARDWAERHPKRAATAFRYVTAIPLVTVIAIGTIAAVVAGYELPIVPHTLLIVVIALVAIAAIFATATAKGSRATRPVGWVVFASFLAVGAAIALARTAHHPKLEPVAVQLRDPDEVIAGFLIGESGDRLYVAELPRADGALASADPVDAVVAVSRDRVTRAVVRQPAGVGTDDEGRDHVGGLLRRIRPAGSVPVEPVATDDPVNTFAPVVHLHSKEKVSPTSADYFLQNAWLAWSHGGCGSHAGGQDPKARPARPSKRPGSIAAADLGSGRYRHYAGCDHTAGPFRSDQLTRPFASKRPGRLTKGEGFYIDLDDSKRRPEVKTNDASQKRLKGPPVYYENRREGRRRRITYWFFYPLSIPTALDKTGDRFVHEGDWEGMSILIEPGPKRGEWVPLSARYHAHRGHVEVPWADLRMAADTQGRLTHPGAYVAVGSHATYPQPGRYEQVLRSGDRQIVAVDDDARACPDCPVWFTWVDLRDATKQPWYGFGGAWGQVGSNTDGTGPVGPSPYKVTDAQPEPAELVTQAGDPAPATAP